MLGRFLILIAAVLAIVGGSGCMSFEDGALVNRCGLFQLVTGMPMRIVLGDFEKYQVTEGPGDIVRGATAWWGLRPYSGKSITKLYDQSGANSCGGGPCDLTTLPILSGGPTCSNSSTIIVPYNGMASMTYSAGTGQIFITNSSTSNVTASICTAAGAWIENQSETWNK